MIPLMILMDHIVLLERTFLHRVCILCIPCFLCSFFILCSSQTCVRGAFQWVVLEWGIGIGTLFSVDVLPFDGYDWD